MQRQSKTWGGKSGGSPFIILYIICQNFTVPENEIARGAPTLLGFIQYA
jgi:hypothetical protein